MNTTKNTSGIKPYEYNVLVLPQDVEEKTTGGIFLPEQVREKDEFGRTEGTLVAVSPMAFSFEDWPEDADKPAIGDHVLFSRYQATEIKGRDGRDYWLMKDKSIIAIMDEVET